VAATGDENHHPPVGIKKNCDAFQLAQQRGQVRIGPFNGAMFIAGFPIEIETRRTVLVLLGWS
jgi:hypothetical protein